MDDSVLIGAVSGMSVAIAFAVMARRGEKLEPKIREVLGAAGGPVRLPDLVTGVGMKDSFINRGKVIQALAPLVAAGQVVEADDANATVKNRLDLKTFRLVA